jgi:hypothetical protein
MSQNSSRRNFLRYVPGALLALYATRTMAAPGQQNSNGTPVKGAVPSSFPNNGPGNTPHSGGAGPSPAQQGGDISAPPKVVPPSDPTKPKQDNLNKDMRADERDIRQQVRQLAEYVDQLKQEIEKTDSTRVLSLDILRRTKDIERLARHIGTLEKG